MLIQNKILFVKLNSFAMFKQKSKQTPFVVFVIVSKDYNINPDKRNPYAFSDTCVCNVLLPHGRIHDVKGRLPDLQK